MEIAKPNILNVWELMLLQHIDFHEKQTWMLSFNEICKKKNN